MVKQKIFIYLDHPETIFVIAIVFRIIWWFYISTFIY